MMDAFIIESLRKEQEKNEWKPTPLTLELPFPEAPEQEDSGEHDKTGKPENTVLRF